MTAGDRTGPGCVGRDCDSGMGWGYGRGFGRGGGRRWRGGSPGMCDAVTREQELEMLKQRAEDFRTAGEEISARIKELEATSKGT